MTLMRSRLIDALALPSFVRDHILLPYTVKHFKNKYDIKISAILGAKTSIFFRIEGAKNLL